MEAEAAPAARASEGEKREGSVHKGSFLDLYEAYVPGGNCASGLRWAYLREARKARISRKYVAFVGDEDEGDSRGARTDDAGGGDSVCEGAFACFSTQAPSRAENAATAGGIGNQGTA